MFCFVAGPSWCNINISKRYPVCCFVCVFKMMVSANAVRATCYWLLAMNRYMWFATMNRNEPSSMNRAPGCDPCNEPNWFERFFAVKSYISHVLGPSWAPSDQSQYWLLFCPSYLVIQLIKCTRWTHDFHVVDELDLQMPATVGSWWTENIIDSQGRANAEISNEAPNSVKRGANSNSNLPLVVTKVFIKINLHMNQYVARASIITGVSGAYYEITPPLFRIKMRRSNFDPVLELYYYKC